ncbi:MAG: Asp-tRNA(Asn)/Glu-tRNA(Gln) amidotransferase subunit GatB [Candidatus Pacebacteria bacterium]|nr:Asp-tRNA(Asn)/Glu-tRNA(Gln) amidotransferase subunit GatB [Candidatus Paceibacterota bacterium]
MKEYKTTIGLEVHAELKTKTKMFCDCRNNPDEERPNFNICPVCMAHPGTLPVINKQAVKNVLKVGLALNAQLADFTEFDRKNYFYPDIPKGYQISQYKYPLVSGGELNGIEITRVHLEEDTASSSHSGNYSLVNYNRAGVPLMELVTEPVIETAKQAGDFARELQLLLRYLRVSDANMEKGEMRVEANISVSQTDELGTKVEIKNLNSFKVVEKAIDYEVKRQIKALENGEKILQETRGWDDNKSATFSQRIKEGSDDYRYFPDPDLPKLKISEVPEFAELELRKEILELPQEKRKRYKTNFGIKDEDIEAYILNDELARLFEAIVAKFKDKDIIKLASNYLTSDLIGLIKNSKEESFLNNIKADSFVELIQLVKEERISSRGAKDILAIMYKQGGSPEKIAEEKKLFQQSDEGELQKIIDQVISENSNVVKEYKDGKETVLGFLVGQGMKISGGSANPQKISELIKKSI